MYISQQWCVLQIWEPGDSPGTRTPSSQKVPVVGQDLCSCGGNRCRLHISKREESRASQEHLVGVRGCPCRWGQWASDL